MSRQTRSLSQKLSKSEDGSGSDLLAPNSEPLRNSDSDSDDETMALKTSIRSLLHKEDVMQPLLQPLLNAILGSKELIDTLVENLYTKLYTKIKNEALSDIKQQVHDSVSHDTNDNKDKLTKLTSRIGELESDITGLQNKLDDQEQYSRRNCLLLHGIPEHRREDTTAICVNQLNQRLGLALTKDNFDRTHRIGSADKPATDDEEPKPRPIIMKFVSYAQRSSVFRSKRKLKGSHLMITESLTKKKMDIMRTAQHLAREHAIKRVWSQDGRITVLDNTDTKIAILKATDLNMF